MFGRGVPLFSLAGFEVKVDLSWAFLALLIAWSLAQGYFPALYEGMPTILYWWMGIAGLIGLAASIVLHELAHSLVARRYDLPIRGITLFIFGGIAEMEGEPEHPKAELMMAIAGPIASLLLAAVFYLTLVLGVAAGAPEAVTGVLRYLAHVNLLLAVFNMIPAFPLDGGRVFRAAMWWKTRDIRRATRWAARSGMLFGALLMALGILSMLSGGFVEGMWWILIGLFLNGAARSSEAQLAMRDVLSGVPVRRFMTANPVAVAPDVSLRRFVEDYVYRHHHGTFPVLDQGRLVGLVSTQQVRKAGQDSWERIAVGDVMEAASEDTTIDADADAMDALKRMQRGVSGRLLVTRDGELIGIIALSDLMKHLSLRQEIEG